MAFRNRSIVAIEDFSRDELIYMLDVAKEIKGYLSTGNVNKYRMAKDKDLIAAILFYENSTRTNTSFSIAAMRLGLRLTGFAGADGTSVKKGESLRHTLDMYSAYQCDAVVLRHPLDGSARFAADHLGIPVFNGGDGKHEHPTQTILDLFTIKEHIGRLDDFDLGIGGDLKYGRTVHSLAIALTKFKNVRLHLFSHPELGMPTAVLTLLKERNLKVVIHSSMDEMLAIVDIFYQTRIQKERMPDIGEFERAKDMCFVSNELMAQTKPNFGLMHPLPMDKTAPSVDKGIDNHPKTIYKRQAGNGVPTRLMELALSLGLHDDSSFQGQLSKCDVEAKLDLDFIKPLPLSNTPLRTDVSIRPIRTNGVVIDHIAPYREELMVQILHVREKRNIYRAGTVKSVARPSNVKGMLMIEDRELTQGELAAVGAISPGCRVNIIRDGKVASKMELSLPSRVCDADHTQCKNAGCITQKKYLESIPPVFVRASTSTLRCYYCDTVMNAHDIFDVDI